MLASPLRQEGSSPGLAADLKVSALSILICAVEALLGMECKITLCLYNRVEAGSRVKPQNFKPHRELFLQGLSASMI